MDRAGLFSLIDPARQRGLEIGALNRPIVTRAMGPIEYIDRAPRAELQAWYAGHDLDTADIVEVDHIWGDQSLLECVGGVRAYDYLVASHVIEHVPDVYGWLDEIASVLVDGGLCLLFVPDRRQTFDVLRRTSASGDFVDAYLRRLRRPDVRQIFNHVYDTRELDAPPLDETDLTQRARGALTMCREAMAQENYVDVHAWVFTPRSLVEALDLASRLGLLPFELTAVEPELAEFFVALRRLPDSLDAAGQRAAFAASVARLSLPDEDVAHGSAAMLVANAERALAHAAAIENSTIWRMTAPLRALVDGLRRRRR